jgi:manganese/zinc/iron transport system permease protein
VPDLGEFVGQILLGHTFRTVAVGAAAMGLISGVIGSFAVARGQSLMGDAVSHATLPGVVVAAMLVGVREPWVLIAGASATGLAAAGAISITARTTPVKFDSALALVLTAAFGLGLVLLVAQSRGDNAQAGLNNFLFGQAAAIVSVDLVTIAVTAVLVLAVVAWRWNEFRAICFDYEFAQVAGVAVRRLDLLLVLLLVVTIAAGLKVVGVVLMSAMLVAPAVAARQWSDRFAVVTALSAGFGVAGGVAGTFISILGPSLATGPLVVLSLGAFALLSIVGAPRHGVVAEYVRTRRRRSRFGLEKTLAAMLALEGQHRSGQHTHSAAAIQASIPDLYGVEDMVIELAAAGLAIGSPAGGWRLSDAGVARARAILDERNIALPGVSR